MTQAHVLTPQGVRSSTIVRSAFARHDGADPVGSMAAEIGPQELELVVLFVTPEADAAAVIARAKTVFAPAPVIGCTTAGELTAAGYAEGELVAIALPRSHFRARLLFVPDLHAFKGQDLIDEMIRNRLEMSADRPDWLHEFTFMMIDGLSQREDALTSELAIGLGPVPLFGGSAGDGTRFERTFVLHDGQATENAAILAQVRTCCPVQVFKCDHLEPTRQRMVVTSATPGQRTVHEINAEPAAQEYARILGKDPNQLDTFTFAAHPVVVQIGGQHHVRAIQQVRPNGDLVFFSAIDEGLVLTLAEPRDMVAHLDGEIAALNEAGTPDTILACDCLLRRLEAQEKQVTHALSRIMSRSRVVGFSTYGEQLNSIHVNQTLTGVAIYPPRDRSADALLPD